MRNGFGVTGIARLFAAAVLASGMLFALAGSKTTQAYSGAQAEAQSDPRSVDPYSFPNIDLCCKTTKKKKKKARWNRRDHGPYGRGRDRDRDDDVYDGGSSSGRPLYVSCGAPERDTYSSIAEALDDAREGDRIVVIPGTACSISGTIDRSVSIETAGFDDGYGDRAALYTKACTSIDLPYGSSVLTFRGVDIEGCLALRNGRLNFNQVNLAWRDRGDAVSILGGSFSSTNSTIRAREGALNAQRAVMVSATGSRFASSLKADYVVRLNVGGATFKDTLIKGGDFGVYVDMQGRYPVTFQRVQVMRGDASEVRRYGLGKGGVVVGGDQADDDLPSLPDMPGAEFSIEEGAITGYETGLSFGAGVKGSAKRVAIGYSHRGIVAQDGAAVELRENRITHARKSGISLDRGVYGTAILNDIQCDDGDCVCYDGDCTSRADREFGRGAFRMSGTRCDD
jgi:hypothetical protein